MTDTAKPPRIYVSPPTIFLLALLGGYALRAVFGAWLPIPRVYLEGIGVVLLSMAAWLFVSAITVFAEHGEALNPSTEAYTLFHSGPYRLSRNPIYLAMMLFGAGFAFASGNLWALLTTGLAGLVLHFFVILPEERYLSAKFGIEYTDYTRRTRRWI